MNSRILIGSALLLGSSIMAFADGNISGKVVNRQTGEPMDYVNIQLLDASGKALPIGTTTDDQGQFSIPDVKDGSYIVRVSNIGSIEQERPVKISGKNINLGVLRLSDDVKLLQEVTVEGIRSQMRFELDKKVFTVDANVVAAGQSASELLESIPSVDVDQDGEVSLRGNSSVTVWINGKDSGLTADNRAQILEQIPAETIERVEVITNPSAKYSPEGTAGIINIVLKKDRKAGYFGSAEISANSRGGGNISGNFNYNSAKWETYASIGFRMRHSRNGSELERTYTDGSDSFMRSYSKGRNHGNNVFVRAGVTYHLTDKDAFYLNGFGMFGHRWGNTLSNYSQNVLGMWNLDRQLSLSKGDNRGAHAEFGYTHKWSDTHTLDMNIGYNHWGGPSWNSYDETKTFNADSDSEYKDMLYREQTQNIGLNDIEAKIDYTNMLNKWLKLEAGYEGRYSHENTPVNTLQGTSQSDMQVNPNLYNRFIYHNNVSALYLTLGGKIKDFSFSAGVRSESWQVRTRSLAYGETKADVDLYKKNFFSLFPSVFLSYSLPKDNELQVNYTRRIRRPWGGQLNSFRNISDPTNISYGNPELEPTYSNSFELNYLKSWTQHVLSVSAYLRTSDNMMNHVSYLDNDIMYTTWVNVASQANSGVEIVSKNGLFKNVLELTTTVNLYNNHISDWTYLFRLDNGNTVPISGKARNSFAWDFRIMANVRLPWQLSLQVTGGYRSKSYVAQGNHDASWNVDAGLRRVFGNWSVSLNCRDIFDSRKFSETINGDNYTQHSKRWRNGRTFRLTLKYSFGNMKGKPNRKNNAEIMDGSGYGSDGQ